MEPRWTIDQLSEAVRRALETAGYNGQDSGRVREVPDKRTIRYYTTLGILDRPVEFQGRTAYYGLRHLVQLVAIKRLQAQGLSLVEVQRSLAGADQRTLAELAGLPEGWETRLAGANSSGADGQGRPAAPADRAAFWADLPETEGPTEAAGQSDTPYRPRPAVALTLAPGVRLVIEGLDLDRLTPAQLRELAPALATLSQAIRRLNGLG